jgi:hypothetical protein
MRSVIVLLGVIITLSYNVNACTCAGSGSPCESYGSAAAVFAGTVVSTRTNQRSKEAARAEDDWAPRAFKFSVEQAYLGVVGTEVEIFTGNGGGDCGYQFSIGQRYLVYAYRYKDKLTTGICTRTKPFTSATEDLAFLGTLPSAAAGVTIYGTVNHNDLDSETLASDVLITIEGESDRKEIRPDAKGRFRVSGLRPGKYKVSVRLPETFTTWEPQREVTVSDHGCAAVEWHVTDNGRVAGRVVNPVGEPVARILVSLIDPDASSKSDNTKLERTDEQGRFAFTAVPRGRYIIAVNDNRYPDPNDPTNAYPTSFYPGVVDKAQAQTITVGAGEKLNELEIRVPAKRPPSILKGTVVWDDGSPIANAVLSVSDVTHSDSRLAHGVNADQRGRFTITGYAGQTLIIEARSNRAYVPIGSRFEPMERTEKTRITLERPTETLQIMITKLR